MNRIEAHEISFEIPSNLNFDTFSAFPVAVNESVRMGGIRAGGDLVKKISEKIGRGLTSSEVNVIRNQVVLNGTHFGAQEWQKQIEYDRFMNEIWIGIVLTLIVISMVFCICSCFLYHQFRHWKQNYRRNIHESIDIESMKLNPEDDDPLPNYTLVSGLPSYEAAVEQLQKSSTVTLVSYPSVFKIFNTIECDPVSRQINQNHHHGKPMRELVPIPSYEEASSQTPSHHCTESVRSNCEKSLMGAN